MVRVVSQNFSPPRSRHSSGETDRDLAERANLALSTLGRKRYEASEYESSSDSFWDSELDGDLCEAATSEKDSNDINGNENPEKSGDVQSKRKERRRERNKLSAQAYRQRRRSQSVKEQQTLMQLEAKNKRLLKLVETLEKKTEHAKHMLRGCTHPMSLQPIGELEGATAEMSDIDTDLTSPRPVGSQLYNPSSSRGPVNLPPLSTPSPTLPPPNFVNKLVHTSVKNEPHQQIPIFANTKAQNFSYPKSSQPSPTMCPSLPQSQLIFNTNVLIGATVSPSGVANLTAVPAFVTVPIENQNQCYPNSNLNCNPFRTYPPNTSTTNNTLTYPDKETSHTKLTSDTSPVFNAVWWGGSQGEPSGNQIAGTIVGLVSMEVCSNSMNNNSINTNDANGNNNCDKNGRGRCHNNLQPMSFNLNINQATGPTGQEVLCQEQVKVKHPVMSVKCFLASGEQMPIQ